MKKVLALILASMMLLTLVACGNNNEKTTENKNEVTTDAGPTEDELAANASVEAIANALINKYAEFTGVKDSYDDMIAQSADKYEKYSRYVSLTAEEFENKKAELEADSDISYYASLGYESFIENMKDIADSYEELKNLTYEEYFASSMFSMEVEANAEWLTGFTEVPTGYSEAYTYGPNMMTATFIGYVFRLAEGTDVEAFKKTLTDTCDPRWNICTSANTTVCESYGNLVYFSMMNVANEENGNRGFTVEQKDGLYNTFIETIENSAK